MGYTGLGGIGQSGGSSTALITTPIVVTNAMIANRSITLSNTPVGSVVLYLEGCTPQLSGVAFGVVGNVITWTSGSWFDRYLQSGQVLYFVYGVTDDTALHISMVIATAEVIANRQCELSNSPKGTVTLYLDGVSPMINGVSFVVNANIVSWNSNSFLGTKLIEGETMYFVY